VAKVADVGLAKVLKRTYLSAQGGIGTFTWAVREWSSGRLEGIHHLSIYASTSHAPAVQGKRLLALHAAHESTCATRAKNVRRQSGLPSKKLATETNGIPLVLFGVQNRTFGPIWQPIIGLIFQLWLGRRRSCSWARM
jgi:hypothetical protein